MTIRDSVREQLYAAKVISKRLTAAELAVKAAAPSASVRREIGVLRKRGFNITTTTRGYALL